MGDGVWNVNEEQIDELVARRHDVDYQLNLCWSMMERGEILPYPFHRAVILLGKARRFTEAMEICNYVDTWCAEAERIHNGWAAKVWLSPKLQDIVKRKPRMAAAAGQASR